jgi:UDP-N-acetylglucosamine--N-acetylmuramyl-(pentapeptide) pyrophosphoryl-undecaprenol N-acetylglucosamine transferase
MTGIRVIFAGGGTGGHVYPAVAMYEGLTEELGGDAVTAMFVGVVGGMEKRLLSSLDVPLRLLPGRGLRRASLPERFLAAFELLRAVVMGIRTIRAFRPDVVVGTGGYASVAMVVAAILTGTPRILQEQNSVPGLANRRLARFANLVLLSYDESRALLPRGVNAAVIGNPLRRTPAADRTAGARFFGLSPARPTVVVMGGSRGAHSLNEAAVAAAEQLLGDTPAQFVLLTGERDYAATAATFDQRRPGNDEGNTTSGEARESRVVVRPYVDEMYNAYSVADVAVSRAGASSVFELSSFGVPTVFVPYPYAADDHQRLNVESLRAAGGVVVVADDELTGERLAGEIRALLADQSRRSRMSVAMSEWVKGDAAREAARRIAGLVKKTPWRP